MKPIILRYVKQVGRFCKFVYTKSVSRVFGSKSRSVAEERGKEIYIKWDGWHGTIVRNKS